MLFIFSHLQCLSDKCIKNPLVTNTETLVWLRTDIRQILTRPSQDDDLSTHRSIEAVAVSWPIRVSRNVEWITWASLLKRVKSGSWNLTTHFSVKAKAVRRTGSEPVKRRFTCCTGETRSIAWRGRHATLASSAPFDRKCKTRARFRRFTVEIDVERTKPETNEQNVVRSRNLALRNILKRWKFRRYVSDN